MATVELTGQNFESVVAGTDMVLVDFWASWCGPCRMFAPVFDRASDKHSDAVFGKVDTDAETGLAQQFNISSIPTLMVIRDNIVLYAQPGALPEQALEELITKARELDMDEVRASIAQDQDQDQDDHQHDHDHDHGHDHDHDHQHEHEHEHEHSENQS
jgi:thioredoxin 1